MNNPKSWMLISMCMMLGLVLPSTQLPSASEPKCKGHDIDVDDFDKRIRRWKGLNVFDKWRLVRVTPEQCATQDSVGVELVLEPPQIWSSRRVPYRLYTKIRVQEATGQPKGTSEKQLQSLVKSVRRLVLRAEALEDVNRFLARFSTKAVEIRVADETDQLEATFLAEPVTPTTIDKHPRLVFSDHFETGVIAYQLPRMDSLPVRRELLRCMELLSLHHPGCRPTWISAQLITYPAPKPESTYNDARDNKYWKFDIELTGKRCPERFQTAISTDGYVVYDTVSTPNPDLKSDPTR